MHPTQPVTTLIHQLPRANYPVKVLQFGSGNFLRGFVDWMLQKMNANVGFNAGVSVVQSISTSHTLKNQQGIYTVMLNGIRDGVVMSEQLKIDVIQRVVYPHADFTAFLDEGRNPDLQWIVSNTTEAGIVFSAQDTSVHSVASTFPGKLTQLLFARFNAHLNNRLIVLPTELVENNGGQLKSVVMQYARHWSLPASFTDWLNAHVTFCNTLVDRIVSGFPGKPKEVLFGELGYIDELVVAGEWFHLWVIEGPGWLEEVLPFRKAGLNVVFTNDLRPYRVRKVRILNGAHTGMALIGRQLGLHTVREAIDDTLLGKFIHRLIFDEVMLHLTGDRPELEKFAGEVIDRFRNPAIEHKLESILLNSFSKFNVRVLPSLVDFMDKDGHIPQRAAFILAALLYYFRGAEKGIAIRDNEEIIARMKTAWAGNDLSQAQLFDFCRNIMSQPIWDADLTHYPQLIMHVSKQLYAICSSGVQECLRSIENS